MTDRNHGTYIIMEDEVLIGGKEKRDIVIVEYDHAWRGKFLKHAGIIARALGDNVLSIEHVGSTSVPGLAAKPIIDILVVVRNSGDEGSYLSPMVEAGYVLRVREKDWYEHRMFRTPELDVHIHFYSAGCEEIRRLLAFRDRLRSHAHELLLYESAKRNLSGRDWSDMNEYARAKTEVVEAIIARALQDGGTGR
jgi:GrpB-like predicted nucleotidyltransferase (UPF0157 family)